MADKKVDDPEPIDLILHPLEEAVTRARNAVTSVLFAAVFTVVILAPLVYTPTTEDAAFTMELAAFAGLNATVGRTVSPAFTLKVHAENPSAVRPWCSSGGGVVVSYSGVALAWGQVPAFCARRNPASELAVLPWGWEVGLPEDLRRRLVSEWRMGAAHLSVEMTLFRSDCSKRTELCAVKSLHRFEPTLLTDVHQGHTH